MNFNLCNTNSEEVMRINSFLFIFILWCGVFSATLAQKRNDSKPTDGQKRIGIARIQIFASPVKGTPITEVSKMPLFFGEQSDVYKYKKRKVVDQMPPTVGDTIRDLTSDSIAVYLKRDLYTMSGYDDKGGNSLAKRNMIHDLPTENPQKMAVDTVFHEAIDISCHWTFAHSTKEPDRYIPSIQIKMEIFDISGQAQPEKSASLQPSEIKTSHFKDEYGVEYDFVKGITPKEIADGGIVGNVVVDVYLQALNKLLGKTK